LKTLKYMSINIRNKCSKCKHKWKDNPGADSRTGGKCPKCGSLYFKWSDYEFTRKKFDLNY